MYIRTYTWCSSTCSPRQMPSAKCPPPVALQTNALQSQKLSKKCPLDKCPPKNALRTIALRTIALHCLEGIWLESIWQRAFGQRMESICLEGICPEGFFWRAIVKEHLAEGFCLGEQVEPNHQLTLIGKKKLLSVNKCARKFKVL